MSFDFGEDPESDDAGGEDEAPPVLGPAVWALAAFCLTCVLAGTIIGFFGPAMFPPKATAAASPPPIHAGLARPARAAK